jgi:hypothetical protein
MKMIQCILIYLIDSQALRSFIQRRIVDVFMGKIRFVCIILIACILSVILICWSLYLIINIQLSEYLRQNSSSNELIIFASLSIILISITTICLLLRKKTWQDNESLSAKDSPEKFAENKEALNFNPLIQATAALINEIIEERKRSQIHRSQEVKIEKEMES